MFALAQIVILWAIALLVLAMAGFALVDAVMQRPEAFVAADKLTKAKWLIILGLATALSFASLPRVWWAAGLPGLFSIASAVAAAVYLVDVRPALRRMTGRGGNRRGNQGPYGPW